MVRNMPQENNRLSFRVSRRSVLMKAEACEE